jgi:hypothetical protein
LLVRDRPQRLLNHESSNPATHREAILDRVPEMEADIDPGDTIFLGGVSEAGKRAYGVTGRR